MITADELRAEIVRLEKRVEHDKEGVNSANHEFSQGSRMFLRKHERELEIHRLALKTLEADELP